MRVVLQRVNRASVRVDNKVVGQIGKGCVLLLGVRESDTEKDIQWMVDKCLNLRIFENEAGKFDNSVMDINGDLLIVSQFTLYGDCRKGRRPSFTEAASPEHAEKIVGLFIETAKNSRLRVETGIFAAKMDVEIHNQGPVTIIIDSMGS